MMCARARRTEQNSIQRTMPSGSVSSLGHQMRPSRGMIDRIRAGRRPGLATRRANHVLTPTGGFTVGVDRRHVFAHGRSGPEDFHVLGLAMERARGVLASPLVQRVEVDYWARLRLGRRLVVSKVPRSMVNDRHQAGRGEILPEKPARRVNHGRWIRLGSVCQCGHHDGRYHAKRMAKVHADGDRMQKRLRRIVRSRCGREQGSEE